MTLNTQLSTVARAAILNPGGLSALLNGGSINIYDGAQPATGDTAITTQNLLATLTFGSPAFGASSGGVATANAITSGTAGATGTAAWCRCFKSDGTTAVFDGSVGASASFNLNISSVSITSGDTVSATSLTLTMSATVTQAGVAYQIAITTQPTGAVDGVAFTTQPVGQIQDNLGQLVAGASGTVTASIASGFGGGTLGGTLTASIVNGVWAFTNLSISGGSGSGILTFTTTGLIINSINSSSFVDQGPLLFSTKWDTSLGTTDAAIGDGGKYPTIYRSAAVCANHLTAVLEVVSASGLNFSRTSNVLIVRMHGSVYAANIETTTVIPQQTSHYGRFFIRNDELTGIHNQHCVTYNYTGSVNAVIERFGIDAANWRIGYGPFGAGYPLDQFFTGVKSVGLSNQANQTWYRYEWFMEWLSSTTYRLHPRVYSYDNAHPNALGTLLFDETTFFQNDYTGSGQSLKDWYDGGGVRTIASTLDAARRFGFGNEGPNGTADTGQPWYIADAAISTSGWIGAT